MKRHLLSFFLCLAAVATCLAQENTVNRIPKVGKDSSQKSYATAKSGVWVSAELLGGWAIRSSHHSFGLGELDVTAGYRWNEFIRAGIGLGVRAYIDQGYVRRHSSIMGMPLYAAARGNFITSKYRKTVPYWGMEIGTSFADGFMIRPTIGLRFGEWRNAWTLGLSYMGQNISSLSDRGVKKNLFCNFLCLRFGFEY